MTTVVVLPEEGSAERAAMIERMVRAAYEVRRSEWGGAIPTWERSLTWARQSMSRQAEAALRAAFGGSGGEGRSG